MAFRACRFCLYVRRAADCQPRFFQKPNSFKNFLAGAWMSTRFFAERINVCRPHGTQGKQESSHPTFGHPLPAERGAGRGERPSINLVTNNLTAPPCAGASGIPASGAVFTHRGGSSATGTITAVLRLIVLCIVKDPPHWGFLPWQRFLDFPAWHLGRMKLLKRIRLHSPRIPPSLTARRRRNTSQRIPRST